MVEMDERELLASLRGYLEELKESGVDELPFGESASADTAVDSPAQAPVRQLPAVSLSATGDPRARLLFVRVDAGLAPASEELLGKIIAAMGFPLPDVHMIGVEGDQPCGAEEVRQAVTKRISSVAPEVVVLLGEKAAQLMMNRVEPLSVLRGRFVQVAGFAVLATLHPDQLVGDESLKRQVWQEMKQVMARLSK